ncbi:MAG TPA: cupin domain-containing protein [Nitrososphaeraceae archaeon]|nr:cupin domain-containing protein [Nitrososphaeraceae archaeon]
MENNSQYWIEKLGLVKHVEGGYYKQIYASQKQCQEHNIRNLATCIFYLLEGNDFSAFHRINADEIWHFFLGSSLTLYNINENESKMKINKLGKDFEKSENLQVIIPQGDWFAAEVDDRTSFTLVGCTVIPGFEYKNFEIGKKQSLLEKFPPYRDLIEKLCRY